MILLASTAFRALTCCWLARMLPTWRRSSSSSRDLTLAVPRENKRAFDQVANLLRRPISGKSPSDQVGKDGSAQGLDLMPGRSRRHSGALGVFLLGSDHVHDGVDEGQVGECLREVAEVAARARVDLLGVELERTG